MSEQPNDPAAHETSESVAQEPPSRRGERTRARILESAEEVFGERGFHEASIVEITSRAGVALGTFYVHFPSKKTIFDELIRTRGRELRDTLHASLQPGRSRRQIEEDGFRRYFEWIAKHPKLYRVARQAEFVDPALMREFYELFAGTYAQALAKAMGEGQISQTDPDVLAWAVMGAADFVAMRFSVWEEGKPLDPALLEQFVRLALRALGGRAGDDA